MARHSNKGLEPVSGGSAEAPATDDSFKAEPHGKGEQLGSKAGRPAQSLIIY